jgi:hypothetical protein
MEQDSTTQAFLNFSRQPANSAILGAHAPLRDDCAQHGVLSSGWQSGNTRRQTLADVLNRSEGTQ